MRFLLDRIPTMLGAVILFCVWFLPNQLMFSYMGGPSPKIKNLTVFFLLASLEVDEFVVSCCFKWGSSFESDMGFASSHVDSDVDPPDDPGSVTVFAKTQVPRLGYLP
jgi:hypothetical protein